MKEYYAHEIIISAISVKALTVFPNSHKILSVFTEWEQCFETKHFALSWPAVWVYFYTTWQNRFVRVNDNDKPK
jgi:hypothetical protein